MVCKVSQLVSGLDGARQQSELARICESNLGERVSAELSQVEPT